MSAEIGSLAAHRSAPLSRLLSRTFLDSRLALRIHHRQQDPSSSSTAVLFCRHYRNPAPASAPAPALHCTCTASVPVGGGTLRSTDHRYRVTHSQSLSCPRSWWFPPFPVRRTAHLPQCSVRHTNTRTEPNLIPGQTDQGSGYPVPPVLLARYLGTYRTRWSGGPLSLPSLFPRLLSPYLTQLAFLTYLLTTFVYLTDSAYG